MNTVIGALTAITVFKKMSEYLRSDNGPEFVTQKLKGRLASMDNIQTACIEPGSLWGNGFVESFNARMRDEFLNTMRFDTYKEAKILTKNVGKRV